MCILVQTSTGVKFLLDVTLYNIYNQYMFNVRRVCFCVSVSALIPASTVASSGGGIVAYQS